MRIATPFELRRNSLLDRIERARPKIVVLVAPAGFGKSTLAQQYLRDRGAVAICDCSAAGDDLDLARRLIPALAVESPDREQSLTQRELMLGDGGTSVAHRIDLALEAWCQPTAGTTFVFENAEHLVERTGARDFLARLLARRPEGRTIFICSRESLRIHLTRFAAPHEILVLRAPDLAFGRSEIARLFAMSLDDPLLDRVIAVAQGWPIAVLLLKRFVDEGRIEELLNHLDDIAFDELHDYLADQVLAMLPESLVEAIFAVACIPHATAADVGVALTPGIAANLAEFAKESPFITRAENGTLSVHPLLASLLLEYHEERKAALLERVASAYADAENYQRAAELHLARGDRAAAAHALGRYEVIRDHTPAMRYARVLASLDRALVRRYPRLWGVTALLRMFCVDTEELFEEAETIWHTLPPETTPLESFYVFFFRALFRSYIGMFEEGLALVEAFGRAAGADDLPREPIDGYVIYLRAVLQARMGRLDEAERGLRAALPFTQGMDVMASGTYLTLGADIARVRGERTLERQCIEHSLEHARRSVLPNFVAFDLAEATFGAWFAGEDTLFERRLYELSEASNRVGARAFSYFTAAARGLHEEPSDADLLKYVALGRLIEAANAGDGAQAIRFAHAALASAEQNRTPFVIVLAAVACALTDELHRDAFLERAQEAASRCESPPLIAALGALKEERSDCGMLTAYASRLRRDRRAQAPPLDVRITDGTVRCHAREVAVAGRELELLTALAMRRDGATRTYLADLLWPELDGYAARNALSVCAHRLRQRLGVDDAIVRTENGYRLHDAAQVDIWEIERVLTTLARRERLTDADRAVLSATYAQLRFDRGARTKGWEWFEAIERRLRDMRMEAAHRLASDALEQNDPSTALELARQMISYDPCDEPARELAIRAYLRIGDRSAAMRQFRQYRETLQAELQCEPSPTLAELVGAGPA